ncbi:MAG: MoaD/ThiS family protein [Verrucomicrobiales bacterium]|nr:MoaD/ThiS family protein [Verrucomicrobiales bacterium]MCP5559801.1 MoaD/ThiS family protein [Verrucomicrobiaceae bacterium]
MKLRVLFFSVLKDITSAEEVPLEVPEGITIEQLLENLFTRWPALTEWEPSLLIAQNQTYTTRSEPVVDNAEIAIMPPVQGG